jgi:hypothetical protein
MDEIVGKNILSVNDDGEEIMVEVCRLSENSDIILYYIKRESFLKYDPTTSKLSELCK